MKPANVIRWGELYVYRDDDQRNAIAVARHRKGPNGGWTADSIARMAVPGKHVTQNEINDYARKFAASPSLYEALERLLESYRELGLSGDAGFFDIEECPEGKQAVNALKLARGEDRGTGG